MGTSTFDAVLAGFDQAPADSRLGHAPADLTGVAAAVQAEQNAAINSSDAL